MPQRHFSFKETSVPNLPVYTLPQCPPSQGKSPVIFFPPLWNDCIIGGETDKRIKTNCSIVYLLKDPVSVHYTVKFLFLNNE